MPADRTDPTPRLDRRPRVPIGGDGANRAGVSAPPGPRADGLLTPPEPSADEQAEQALAELKRQYVDGEIAEAEFERKVDRLVANGSIDEVRPPESEIASARTASDATAADESAPSRSPPSDREGLLRSVEGPFATWYRGLQVRRASAVGGLIRVDDLPGSKIWAN